MKELSNTEKVIRFMVGYILLAVVYLILLPFIIVAFLTNIIGQIFNNISKILTPDFDYLNNALFAIRNGISKQQFDADMKKMREQIIAERRKSEAKKNE